jgi:ATP-binding cassette subfamily F protein 2
MKSVLLFLTLEHIKKFIASCGTFANLVRQAKSRQKILDKMEADGLVEKVPEQRLFDFTFKSSGRLPPPVVSFTDMTFSYSGKLADAIYRNLEFGCDTESRIALVGPNGTNINSKYRCRKVHSLKAHEW